ncbi:Dynamin family protein [Paraoerskovia marina]|uniref:Dynamin family protein n=1 Tax=Paraoerskovia marina TaxID=545619 RepID=A0A1H1UAD6_9CELL|nr:GTPase domain-containing protein [Paraoerskovia marina]SDS69472.1 Dynamin family protein [Paraoerskovia marina]
MSPAAEPSPLAGGSTADLIGALEVLRGRLDALRLTHELPDVDAQRRTRRRSIDQLDDYMLPRLRASGAPLLVVVGGSTGAGKSTLVNSLLGRTVSAPGVLRPTTRSPVLAHHPDDVRWFTGDRVFPGLTRGGQAGRSLRLVPSDALPAGLALLDAPDVDSVAEENRDLAAQLLAAADLWLFVTTPARYADAVPWDVLQSAVARHAQVALVLDRLDQQTHDVPADLRTMMDERGLSQASLFTVPEADLVDGLLPSSEVRELSAWLTALGGDGPARERVAVATRDGAVDDVVDRTLDLAAAADEQVEATERLRASVRTAYAEARSRVRAATRDGTMLRGEVLARWQDFVGTSEFFRSVEKKVGRARDSVVGFFRGRPARAPQVQEAIAHGLEALLLDAAEAAAERTWQSWRSDPAGRALTDDASLSRASAGLREQVGAEIRGWQGDVLDLVREQGANKRGLARALSFGLNGVAVSLMVVVFASTGGLTGAEVGIAGGTAVVAQKLLEAVFGDDAVRRLARDAQDRLDDRVDAVLDPQARRYTTQLDALGAGEPGGQALRDAADAVRSAALAEREGRPEPVEPVPVVTPESHADPASTPRSSGWRRLFGRGTR